jgi:hypothetical protein
MKVIGTGLPRTGTLSQKVALDLLGIGPCYHMVNVLANLPLVADWQAALDGHGDLAKTLDGFESTVDWPGGYFYKELLELYPDAKVLHSVRDPPKWEKSMRQTVWAVFHGHSLLHHLSDARACVDPGWAGYQRLMMGLLWNEGTGTLSSGHETAAGMIAAADAFTAEIVSFVPADQLLVYDVTEGWEPLCEFLEVKVPEEPMPRVNDGEEFKRRIIEISLVKLQAYWAANGGPVTGATPAASPVR